MAKCDMKMPEDFLLKISKLGSNFDSVADTVLQAGGEVVLKKVKSKGTSILLLRRAYPVSPEIR